MLAQSLYNHLTELLTLQLGQPVKDIFVKSIGGGSINQTYHLRLNNGAQYFCKINNAHTFPQLFLKEKRGLQLLQQTGVIAVPQVLLFSQHEEYQLLLLEWIESGVKDKHFFSLFGQQLAALHSHTQPLFGLEENNYMGSVPQQNTQSANWVQFYTEQRLQPLVKTCIEKGLLTQNDSLLFEALYKKLPLIFNETQPPSLLHGDLWSGNYMCNSSNQPVLIDPAVYYGHPAVDLAMTTLFGGFDRAFYESYHYHLPLPQNHQEQWQICNLYPLLIHLLLFGRSYYNSVQQTLKTFA